MSRGRRGVQVQGRGGAGRAPPSPQWEAPEIHRFQACHGLLRWLATMVTPEPPSPNIGHTRRSASLCSNAFRIHTNRE